MRCQEEAGILLQQGSCEPLAHLVQLTTYDSTSVKSALSVGYRSQRATGLACVGAEGMKEGVKLLMVLVGQLRAMSAR